MSFVLSLSLLLNKDLTSNESKHKVNCHRRLLLSTLKKKQKCKQNTKSSVIFNQGNYLSKLEVSPKAPNIYVYLILKFRGKLKASKKSAGILISKEENCIKNRRNPEKKQT